MKDKFLIVSRNIARWKIDTKFENWLSYRADYSELWKIIYVLYYRIFDRKYYNCGLKFINKQLDIFKLQWDGLDKKVVIRDMVYCLHRFGADFQDYWNYNF